MASRTMLFRGRPSYIFPTMDVGDDPVISATADHNLFEFEEADVWSSSNESTSPLEASKKPRPGSRSSKKLSARKTDIVASASLPVNIPDWSKILKEEYREHGKRESDEDFDDEDGEDNHDGRLPPHEYLARRRGASFSVHEGIGRTLKGRDLRRVRNAIWKKTGFED